MAKAKRNVQDNYNSVFAKRLRELIETSGVSQAELANSVGVTRQAINSYTLGNTVPNSDVLTDIAKYFDVSSDYLLGLIDIKSNDITVKSICEEIGLSDKSVNLLIYLNRIKKLEKEARTLLAKDTNRNLVRESDYFDCEASNKLFSYLDIINYFTENVTYYWNGMEILRRIATVNIYGVEDESSIDTEDDRLLLNPDYSHYLFGKFIEGEEYALFLKQLVENEFHTMLSDFENDVNPFDEEAAKYRLPRHEESLQEKCRLLKKRIEDIKEGEKTGNHRKEE
jgi:transcriptional regulator with XRE-family HTH domain